MLWCPVDRLKNRVQIVLNMQQEGVASVLLPHPTSHVRAFVLPCLEAPTSESTVLAADVGAEPTGSAGALVLRRGEQGWGGGSHENKLFAALPSCQGCSSMHCTSTLVRGV